MTNDDLFRTRRDVITPVAAELSAAGFEDAEEIGHGGFGVVYRCRQVALDRTVAVKVLTAELDEESRARFFREERAMGRLTGHPNIVTVLQTGVTPSGRPYLVMPYHPLDSLDAWIRRQGPLRTEEALRIGVKVAGALDSAHQLGIVHRDVKPGNILLTEYGEPALTDFGIARIAGGFQTATGKLTGSPAFTAPEVLEGEAPGPAADVYGLGATLFCALTGHAAFERRSGENVVSQFLRITTEPTPDLHGSGIPEDLSAAVATAMSRDPRERPSAAVFGETLQRMQRRHGYAIDEMALHLEPNREPRDHAQQRRDTVPTCDSNLPLELTSFIDRRTETAEVKNLLSTHRLVTLTGIGGVGKTRLAMRSAANARRDFAEGVRVIELADVRDQTVLVEVVAATLGLRDDSHQPVHSVVLQYLSSREILLVLDNCEQVVEALAELVETLLLACPNLRILVTTREPLDIAGEAVLRVLPLTVPDPDHEPTFRGLPKYDAVTLFADRAAAVVPGFELTEDNKATVARICSRLDGLPLAIELAAARMRAMSPAQILRRLTDRYALLTRSSRTAPERQQTLRWCIDWSYQLCTPDEQRIWARLSVFAGGFELDAAEQVCGGDLAPATLLDVLSSLVDKSIVIREESDGVVRFRMLETMRDYGREKLQETDEYQDLRRRHRDWYERLALAAEAEWISDRQLDWLARLDREQQNFRAMLEFCLAEDDPEATEAGLRTATALFPFWSFRGVYSEGRRWLKRALAHPGTSSIQHRAGALHAATVMAAVQGNLDRASALTAQSHTYAEQDSSPIAQALVDYADGAMALRRDEPARAASFFEAVIEALGSNRRQYLYLVSSLSLAMAYTLQGDTARAIEQYERVLSITEACGETLYRANALWGIGIAAWQQGEPDRAQELLKEAIRVSSPTRSSVLAAFGLEALAWVVADSDGERSAILMGAAKKLWPRAGGVSTIFPNLSHYHDQWDRETRRILGKRGFDAAFRHGQSMGMDAAVAYALGQQPNASQRFTAESKLTKREREIANLVAQGLTNKQIAAKLVISRRTAEGHIEHILTKLGFTSRAQIAAWIVDEARQDNP
ncbi:protein kinase domain-containing protein [Nocardia pseudovaccinii]|uniref:protein kinase domain-containing protein n=1 Tax=Nocardia pseudovaccinii TaxID=189540 RepID=UPI0007A4FA70|nr:protein kinase [Nocardia pseudovaccinii]